MENIFENPVTLDSGINLRELLTSGTEFHIDADFKRGPMGDDYPDLDDDDDSDSDDVLKNIEQTAEKMMLSSPEYHTFSELETKMIDCVASGDVKMLIIEEGDGPIVPVDAEVTLHYAAYWEKAKIPFDSTLTMNCGAPLRLKLGSGRIIPGLEIGLTSVKGPKARFLLLVRPAAAWGRMGVQPRVKPEPALFSIVLYDVRDCQAGSRFNSLPMDEQKKFKVTLTTVKSLHEHAKYLFSKKKYEKAIKDYQQCISILNISQPESDTEVVELKKLKIASLVNLAMCFYKINKPKHVINMLESLDHIIDINTHCKALFYYGRAYELQGKCEDAVKYYKKALVLEPRNTEIGAALAKLDKYNKDAAIAEKEIWQKAFESSTEQKIVLDVDEDFRNGVLDMCKELSEASDYTKFDLPPGLSKNEVNCIKSLAEQFKDIVVLEDGEGSRKKVTIVKKMVP